MLIDPCGDPANDPHNGGNLCLSFSPILHSLTCICCGARARFAVENVELMMQTGFFFFFFFFFFYYYYPPNCCVTTVNVVGFDYCAFPPLLRVWFELTYIHISFLVGQAEYRSFANRVHAGNLHQRKFPVCELISHNWSDCQKKSFPFFLSFHISKFDIVSFILYIDTMV